MGKAFVFFGAEEKIVFEDEVYTNSVWAYDFKTNKWEERKKYDGLSKKHASSFTIGNHIYTIGGQGIRDDETVELNEFLKYDAVSDSWQELVVFPGEARSGAMAFVNNNIAYYGLGSADNFTLRDFWSYNPSTEEWLQLSDFPGSLPKLGYFDNYTFYSRSVNFIYQNNIYVLTGEDYDHPEMWSFNIETGEWNQITNFDFEDEQAETFFMPRTGAISLTHQGFGYVILGVRLNSDIGNGSVYRYDFENSKWKTIDFFPGRTRTGAFGYSYNNSIVFGSGYNSFEKNYELWAFKPPEIN